MIHRIYEVRTLDDFELEITFYTGEVKIYDVKRLAAYEEKYRGLIKDKELFKNVHIKEGGKGIYWAETSNKSKTSGERYDMDSEGAWFEGTLALVRNIDDDSINFARRVMVLREQMGMTQAELSKKSRIHQTDISKIERGVANPSFKTICKLVRAMNHRIDFSFKTPEQMAEHMDVASNLSPYLPAWKRQGDYTLKDIMDLPGNVYAELFDGVIYDVAGPTVQHQRVVGDVYFTIRKFIEEKKGDCEVFITPMGVISSEQEKNYVMPDLFIVCDKENIMDRYIKCPDFVMEVTSPSTSIRDYKEKRNLYDKMGVKEYWIVDLQKERLVIYDSESVDVAAIHTFDETVPIGIYGGKLLIDLSIFKE